MEELRNPTRYMQIIEAIAMGKPRLTEIAQYTGMEVKDLSVYIRVLSNLGIVRREVPVTERKAKMGIYVVEDEYFRFYHRFVSPHYGEIDSLNPELAVQDFLRNFNTYLGKTFEKAAKEFLMELNKYMGVCRLSLRKSESGGIKMRKLTSLHWTKGKIRLCWWR